MPENITPEEEKVFDEEEDHFKQWIKDKEYSLFGARCGTEWRNKYNVFVAKSITNLYAIFKKESEEVNKKE
jgi:hypothetical protein